MEATTRGAYAHINDLSELYLGKLPYPIHDPNETRVEPHESHADRAVMLARTRGERGTEAWALRLLGEIASHQARPDIATTPAHYGAAMTLASELKMRPLVAHCHRGLGTLYAATGQREPARTTLSTAIAMYQSMEMMFWLPQAETVLAQVDT